MKTAKQPVPDGASGSNRRAQPVRQTRVNPPRTSSLNRVNPLSSAPVPEQPINILPGVTHFTDAITALPKELVRHFTLLKEVDAKIFAPEAALFQLLQDAINTPALDANGTLNDAASSTASIKAPANAQSSGTTATTTGAANPPAPPSDDTASSVFDPANIPRRTLFRDTAFKIQGMLVALEEKNHLIATANDALQKQLSRIEDIWPHLEGEFSDEAKWGSTTHWAYMENRQAKVSDKQAERSRREGAATLSAAAQQLAEEAAARSNDRKQALAAKKNSKNQAADAEADKAQETGKKVQGAKSRKPLPDAGPVGLGISPGPAGPAPPNKRRKVETAKPNGGAAVERAMGTVFGNNASKQKTTSPRETPAPESGNKKRKALPTSSGQTKKSRTNAAMSPSVTSSPVIGAFPDPARVGGGSPAPSTSAPRPVSSRARQNSMQSSVDGTRQHPPSAASNKPIGNLQGTPDSGLPSNGAKANADAKAHKETALPALKPSLTKQETEELPPTLELAPNGSRREAAAKASEDGEPPKETAQLSIQPPSLPVSMVKTKSGRASKPSTPAIATFAEAASNSATSTMASSRSRPSRNTDSATSSATSTAATSTTGSISGNTTTAAKRSHKKGASISAAAAALAQQAAQQQQQPAATAHTVAADKDSHKDARDKESAAPAAGKKERDRDRDRDRDGVVHAHSQNTHARAGTNHNGSNSSSNNNGNKNDRNAPAVTVNDEEEEEDEQDNPDEDLYCYCNQVSYGEMVACDGEGCPREWFHLECVGLKVAPKGNAKWYCEDCKKRLKIAERR